VTVSAVSERQAANAFDLFWMMLNCPPGDFRLRTGCNRECAVGERDFLNAGALAQNGERMRIADDLKETPPDQSRRSREPMRSPCLQHC
jgi:hypothetical protein